MQWVAHHVCENCSVQIDPNIACCVETAWKLHAEAKMGGSERLRDHAIRLCCVFVIHLLLHQAARLSQPYELAHQYRVHYVDGLVDFDSKL
jgi:hypothetical protein